MNDDVNYMSAEGFAAMQAELFKLKSIERREIANRIEKAKEMGDLRENADYQEAKNDLAMLESKIQEYDAAILRTKVIQKPTGDKVEVGSTVTVRTAEGKERTYAVVGHREASPMEGRISNESPLGQALLGRKVGEQAEFKAPAGTVVYTVIKID